MASEFTWKNETICQCFPVKVSAEGLAQENYHFFDDLLSATLTLLNIQILLIFAISNSLHFLLKRLWIPSFVAQSLTGIILGPTLLGRTDFFRNKLFPQSSQENLEVVAMIGYATFMFLVSVKMDMGMVMNSGKKVLTIGLASLFLPLVVGLAAQHSKIREAESKFAVSQIFTVTGIQSLTAFAVVSQLLSELRLTNSEIGRLALSSALVTGSVGSFLQLISITLASDLEVSQRVENFAGVVFFVLVAVFVLRPVLFSFVVKRTPAGERVHPAWVILIFAMATGYQLIFDSFKTSYVLGPYVFGLVVIPPGPPLGSVLVETLETISQAVFFPVYVATTVMKADLNDVLSEFDDRGYFVALIYWSAILKFVVCLMLSMPWMPAIDSVVLSLIMSSKGVVDISIHAFMRDTRTILPELYSLFILAIIVNATVVPILVTFLYEPSRRYVSYHSRNIYALKAFNELRILACIHKPHHIASVTKLLDNLCRTEEGAIALSVIHLLEQVGHATPVFISHHKKQKRPSSSVSDSSSASIDVIFAFSQYEKKNVGFTSVQTFTSISQYKLMQEDVFTLALDKLVSVILVPFHRKWSIDGRVESEDNVLRALNTRILDTAPCSVGILFDRGSVKGNDFVAAAATEEYTETLSESSSLSSSRSVCMIYLGGRDDQEAVSLAKRMAHDPCVHLTIMHMVSDDLAADIDLVLRGVLQETMNLLNVQYVEKPTSDGTETARLVSSMASQYDLFVVGRRHDVDMDSPQTAGLANWSEFPELGVIGDLLASKDVHTRGSVLVVQQQKKLN